MYHFGNEILGETETKTLSELGFKTNSELVVRLRVKGGGYWIILHKYNDNLYK